MSDRLSDKDFTLIREEMQQELERLLHFWSTEAIDTKNDGFIGRIDHTGKKDWQAGKGMVLNARILWTFSAAIKFTSNQKYRQYADRAYDYLMKYFWEKENGGFIWTVDYKGNPLNTRKQAYALGFGIYGLSEYHMATGHKQSLDCAIKLHEILEEKYRDKFYDGYIESLNKDWGRMEDMRLSEKDANFPKSMNTHLHILEPYTNLYRVWPNEELKERIRSLSLIFVNKILNHRTNHLNLFFEMDWTPKSTLISFGHDIEAAWLLHAAVQVIEDQKLIDEVQKISLKLVEQTIIEGFDNGSSIYYEREGNDYDTEKHWWPQAEAMVGLMDAWDICQNEEYLVYIKQFWAFIKNKLFDMENGEWFWSVDINGFSTRGDKLGLWKCPYHSTRALMEMVYRINRFD